MVTVRGLTELSSMYRLGMGVPVDIVRAAAYTRAAFDAAVSAHAKGEADADFYLSFNLRARPTLTPTCPSTSSSWLTTTVGAVGVV